MNGKPGPKSPMTAEHKAALARGRAEGRVVKEYLEALRASKPKRGRKRTAESIKKRLEAIDSTIHTADPLNELKLVQQRRDLTQELEQMRTTVDLGSIEKRFVEVAKGYSERQGISYSAWREVGVEPKVLKQAGINRGS
jgi:uncharacterized protein YicC (UPF0701 family)